MVALVCHQILPASTTCIYVRLSTFSALIAFRLTLATVTIPTFTWIKLYPNDGNVTGQYPHHSLSCNVVNKGQMLVIGGTFPLTDDCDAAPQWGAHNLVLGQQSDPDANPWQLYSPNLTTYAVPDEIISVVGGQATGGATRTAPAGGFDNSDLDVLMTKRASAAARTPTRPIPGATSSASSSGGTHLSTGAIVGIAVGGAVALIALIVGLCVFIRRHRRFRYGATGGQHGGPKSSAGGSSSPYTFGPGTAPWSPNSAYSGAAVGGGGGAHTPSSYGAPPSPFARRPSNINVQQGPAELAAPVPDGRGDYDVSPAGAGGGGGPTGFFGDQRRSLRASHRSVSSSGVVPPYYGDQPKFDDSGRPWYPQVSRMDDGPFPSPRSVSTGHSPGGGYSPAQEMDSRWPLGGGETVDTGWDDRDERPREGRGSGRHETFYHP